MTASGHNRAYSKEVRGSALVGKPPWRTAHRGIAGIVSLISEALGGLQAIAEVRARAALVPVVHRSGHCLGIDYENNQSHTSFQRHTIFKKIFDSLHVSRMSLQLRLIGVDVSKEEEVGRDHPWKRKPPSPGRINIDDLITHTMPLDDINDAFALMDASESIMSVVLYD